MTVARARLFVATIALVLMGRPSLAGVADVRSVLPPTHSNAECDIAREVMATSELLEEDPEEAPEAAGGAAVVAMSGPTLVPLAKLAVPVLKNGVTVSYKNAYAGNITLGWPSAVEFSVLFDTGSAHVVVPSVTCKSKSCSTHRTYNVSESPSGYPVNTDGTPPKDDKVEEVSITFGTGEITGEFARDVVCVGLGGAELAAAQASGQPPRGKCTELSLISATEMSDDPFASFSFDGIFGLGLKSLAVNPLFSFSDQFGATSQMPSIFGMYIAGGDKERGHELAIGGYNAARVQGPLSWTPVLDADMGYWQVEVRGVRIGDEDAGIDCSGGGCHAIVDTGSSHLGLPRAHMRSIRERLSTPPGEAADCRDTSTLPMHIDLDGFTLTLEAKDYMRKLPLKNREPSTTTGAMGLTCRPRLMPVSMPDEFGRHVFILGEPVLQRYYAAFDHGAHRVGFGLAQRDSEEDTDVVLLVQVHVTMRRRIRTTSSSVAVQMTPGALVASGHRGLDRPPGACADALGTAHGTKLHA